MGWATHVRCRHWSLPATRMPTPPRVARARNASLAQRVLFKLPRLSPFSGSLCPARSSTWSSCAYTWHTTASAVVGHLRKTKLHKCPSSRPDSRAQYMKGRPHETTYKIERRSKHSLIYVYTNFVHPEDDACQNHTQKAFFAWWTWHVDGRGLLGGRRAPSFWQQWLLRSYQTGPATLQPRRGHFGPFTETVRHDVLHRW